MERNLLERGGFKEMKQVRSAVWVIVRLKEHLQEKAKDIRQRNNGQLGLAHLGECALHETRLLELDGEKKVL